MYRGCFLFCRLLLKVGLLILLVSPLTAQQVRCQLQRVDNDTVTGTCGIGADNASFSVRLEKSDRPNTSWSGTLSLGGGEADFQVGSYRYSDGVTDVVRTPFGWFLPSVVQLDKDPPELFWSAESEAPPSHLDVQIIQRTRELLGSAEVWDRADDRVCSPSDTEYSLYCAMSEATRQVAGEYQHRQPALQFVRRVVAEFWPSRIQNHRLMDFNNDPQTTFQDLERLFDEVERRVKGAVR